TYSEYIRAGHISTFEGWASEYVLLGQGDLVAELYTANGEETRFSLAVPAVDIIRLENGRIVEMWTMRDNWLWEFQKFDKEAAVPPEDYFPALGESSTTPEENVALAERALELWQTGNTDNIADVYADELVFHLPLSISTQPLDRDGVAHYISYLHVRMPDFTIETEDYPQVAEGDLVVCYYKWNGKFTPEDPDERARTARAEAVDVYRIQDGKIVEVWWNWSIRSFMGKLTWFAPPVES
ncbi:MAG: nuclear transport factor 2 family protein, partial [Candidatus Methanoperedens sp.]|nr:nuclear transport factor 2 family protein [Candidatus Methanoperedens sp.]